MTTHESKDSSKNPFVTIIIPVRNAGRTMDETFVYLFGGTSMNGKKISGIKYPLNKMEVIVADGDSSDNTVEIIKKWQKKFDNVRFTQIPKCKSPGHARTAALKLVKGDYILFTDGDCAPEPDWVDKLIEPFLQDPQIGMVGGEVYTLQFDPQNKVEHYCEQIGFLSIGDRVGMKKGGYYPPVEHGYPREVNGSQTCPFFATANAAVSTKAALAIGNNFWDEITAEDVDFSLRIQKAGYKVYFQPGAVVNHMHRASLKEFCRQVGGYGFGHPLVIKTHAKRVLEFRLQLFGEHSIIIPFPFQTMIYWGDFHFMHLFGIWAFIKTLIPIFQGMNIPEIMGSNHVLLLWFLFFFFLVKYFSPVLRIQPASGFLLWCWIRYRSNLAMFWGGLKGTMKFKRLYIELSW
jgi:cellulose synthase/poly-beta-1,6-N-acetylglucosamine synthase-like glycosyltransferase